MFFRINRLNYPAFLISELTAHICANDTIQMMSLVNILLVLLLTLLTLSLLLVLILATHS